MSALIVCGAIASSGGYAFADIQIKPQCIPSPTHPCFLRLVTVGTDIGHDNAMYFNSARINQIREIFKSKQAIQILEIYDQDTVDKLIQGDAPTLQKLEQLSSSTKLQVQLYLQQLDQTVIDQ
ncbi:hypothetical protein H6G76_33425 [Nostoc sp. FACHB-152]|uniref:hypothetical protein n=1 Tax=unclassified Nostoc TaxID=2593658 RepID=UPI0016848C40|nr:MULTISPECIES: hypothetical protein [unclassified Nostoc]MBD2451938.1 hypothetical protein [Nostoc sp. FACHB-152]MBD2472569.1 hypothetical protein [Nostoc sp. FACHB-145]